MQFHMCRKFLNQNSLAQASTPIFSEVMKDAQYTPVSVHDCITFTMTRSPWQSGEERLNCLSKESD